MLIAVSPQIDNPSWGMLRPYPMIDRSAGHDQGAIVNQ
jgi:hypothetical protein